MRAGRVRLSRAVLCLSRGNRVLRRVDTSGGCVLSTLFFLSDGLSELEHVRQEPGAGDEVICGEGWSYSLQWIAVCTIWFGFAGICDRVGIDVSRDRRRFVAYGDWR